MRTKQIILARDGDGHPTLTMFFSDAEPGSRPYIEHHHTQLEISAVVSGGCEWQVRHTPLRCREGDIVILGSDEEHYITAVDGTAPFRLLNLQFEPRYIWSPGSDMFDSRYLGIFLNHGESFNNRLDGETDTARRVSELLRRIYREGTEAAPEYELMIKAELMLILALLGREYHDILRAAPDREQRRYLQQLDEAMSYINRNISSDLTLDDIPKAAGMSRSYFSTVFKRMNGISVWRYVNGKRIERAMRYLDEGGRTVTEIATLCGFSNIANFNRSFRMIARQSPSEFRRSRAARDRQT